MLAFCCCCFCLDVRAYGIAQAILERIPFCPTFPSAGILPCVPECLLQPRQFFPLGHLLLNFQVLLWSSEDTGDLAVLSSDSQSHAQKHLRTDSNRSSRTVLLKFKKKNFQARCHINLSSCLKKSGGEKTFKLPWGPDTRQTHGHRKGAGGGHFRERVKEPKVSENIHRFWQHAKETEKARGGVLFGFRLQKSETTQLDLMGNQGLPWGILEAESTVFSEKGNRSPTSLAQFKVSPSS